MMSFSLLIVLHITHGIDHRISNHLTQHLSLWTSFLVQCIWSLQILYTLPQTQCVIRAFHFSMPSPTFLYASSPSNQILQVLHFSMASLKPVYPTYLPLFSHHRYHLLHFDMASPKSTYPTSVFKKTILTTCDSTIIQLSNIFSHFI